jgi:uncharacterized phiE125 gp8 family phage protein
MLSRDALGLDGDMLDEAKAYLRLESGEEDAPLGAIILAAIAHAESFTAQMLIRRGVREIRGVSAIWQRLTAAPVTAFNSLTGIPAEGVTFNVPVTGYSTEIDSNGEGHFRITQPGSAGRVEVAYQAGLAASWAELPEALRLGILRLVGYLYANRDAGGDTGPPEAVSALLRPWRRMTLS